MGQSKFDVCVIGGGPAGLGAAIALAQVGRSTIVIDHALPPIDKACGEGLMPDSIAVLQQLGITLPSQVGYRFRGIRFQDSHASAVADFPGGSGVGLRRTVLHSLLKQRAERVGVTIMWGARVAAVERGRVTLDGVTIHAEWVVGADGQNSAFRRHSCLNRSISEKRRYGFRRHYQVAPWSQHVELYWGDHCQIYIAPVAENEVGVAVLSRNPKLRIDGALKQFPQLESHLRDARHSSKEMGSLSISRRLHNVCRDQLALVGDASGSVDAITGEGLGLSFHQSLALAAAVGTGEPAFYYNRQHRILAKRVQTMSALLLMLDKHPSLRKRVLAGLASCPRIFSSLLAFHVGQGTLNELPPWDLIQFCRSFVAG